MIFSLDRSQFKERSVKIAPVQDSARSEQRSVEKAIRQRTVMIVAPLRTKKLAAVVAVVSLSIEHTCKWPNPTVYAAVD